MFPTLEELSELCEDLKRDNSKIEAIENLARTKHSSQHNDSLTLYLSDSAKRDYPIKVVYPVVTDFSRSLLLVHKDKFAHKIATKLLTILPNFHYEMKQIAPLKVVSTPLTRFLTYKPAKAAPPNSVKPRGF